MQAPASYPTCGSNTAKGLVVVGRMPRSSVCYKVQLLGNFHIIIAFVPSPITDKGTTTAKGKENRIEALPNTPIDGWMD